MSLFIKRSGRKSLKDIEINFNMKVELSSFYLNSLKTQKI